MPRCLLGLGANLGDRRRQLDEAIALLARDPRFRVAATSRYLGTAPVGGPGGQGEFLNAAAVVETSVAPMEMWHALRDVEHALGRQRHERWEARSIDLDLLLYDQLVCDQPELTVPHPWMFARRFVLQPAVEIAPAWQHPVLGWSLQQLWQHAEHAPPRFALDTPSLGNTKPSSLQELLPAIAERASCAWLAAPPPSPSDTPVQHLERRLNALEASAWNGPDPAPLLSGFSVESDWRDLLQAGLVRAGDPDSERLRARLDRLASAKIIFSTRDDDPLWLSDLVRSRRSLAALVRLTDPVAIVREIAGAVTAIQSD
jgi:2-amino-4-hydroxy-6-hydroxymethyldihydropteridine diphosphokinase